MRGATDPAIGRSGGGTGNAVAVLPGAGEPEQTSFTFDGPTVRFVESLGLGTPDRWSAEPLIGRNDSCVVPTDGGARVFLKRMTGTPADSRARLERSTSFLECSAGVPAPTHLGTDRDLLLTAYEFVPDARSASGLLEERELVPEVLSVVGAGLAALHDSTPGRELDSSAPLFPSPTLHHRLDLVELYSFSAAELALWRIVQDDDPLRAALTSLSASTSSAGRAPVHCDLRLDQILVGGRSDEVVVTDWEEFRASDPARDPGALVGDLLFRVLLDVTSGVDSGAESGADADEDPFVRSATEALARIGPHVRAFWDTYAGSRSSRPGHDFVARTAALAGWHLLDRVLSAAKVKARLTATDRALVGIARTILTRPSAAAGALGLGPGTDVTE